MSISQNKELTPEQLDRVYQKVVKGEACEVALIDMQGVVVSLSANIDSYIQRDIEREAKLSLLSNEKEKLIQDVAKAEARTNKRFGIGVGVFLDLKGNPNAGIGISYNLIRF